MPNDTEIQSKNLAPDKYRGFEAPAEQEGFERVAPPPGQDWEEDKILIGMFTFLEEKKTRFGMRKFATIVDDTGNEHTFGLGAWLATLLTKQLLNRKVRIEYLGESPSDKGENVKVFDVQAMKF